jgi:hypothetical protein
MPGTSERTIPENNKTNNIARLIAKHPDDKELQRVLMQEIQLKSSDNARTPMQVSILPPSSQYNATY